MNDWLPAPHDLQQDPELAALAILEAAADTTQVALLAAHPDLWEDPRNRRDHRVAADVAKMLCDLIDRIRDRALLYRCALVTDAPHRSAHVVGPDSRTDEQDAARLGKTPDNPPGEQP